MPSRQQHPVVYSNLSPHHHPIPPPIPPDVEPVIESYRTWSQSLWHDHTAVAPEDRSVARALKLCVWSYRTGRPDSPMAELVMNTDLLRTLLRILKDKAICGFKREDFVITEDTKRRFFEHIIPYIIDILAMIGPLLDHILRLCHSHDRDKEVRLCKRCASLDKRLPVSFRDLGLDLTLFFHLLLDLQRPVLIDGLAATTSWFETTRHTNSNDAASNLNPGTDMMRTLGYHITQCVHYSQQIFLRYRGDAAGQSHLSNTLFVGAQALVDVWMNDPRADVREVAILCISSVFSSNMGDEWTPRHGQFYSRVISTTSRHRLQRAFLRDLKYWSFIRASCLRDPFYVFGSIMDCMHLLRPEPLHEMDMLNRSRTECGILWYALAASRTLICSGEHTSHWITRALAEAEATAPFEAYITRVIGDLHEHEDPPIPELWVHAMIFHFTHSVKSLFATSPQAIPNMTTQWISTVLNFSHMLSYYRSNPGIDMGFPGWPGSEPPPPSVRRFSLQSWKAVEELMVGQRVSLHVDPGLIQRWKRVTAALERDCDSQGPPESNLALCDFEPLRRCAYQECACSVFKPTHKMKVCRRCWLVAYCGKRCRQMDRETHSAICGVGT